MLYLIDNQIVISIIINIHYPELRFLDLFWMYSFSQGKLSIPKVWQAKKVYLIGSKLVENKEFLTHLHQKLAIVQ